MKKLFALLAITSLMVACNSSGESKETPADSSTAVAPAADSTVQAPAAMDSTATAMPDSAAKK